MLNWQPKGQQNGEDKEWEQVVDEQPHRHLLLAGPLQDGGDERDEPEEAGATAQHRGLNTIHHSPKKHNQRIKTSAPSKKTTNYRPSRCLYTSIGLQQCIEGDSFTKYIFKEEKIIRQFTLCPHSGHWNEMLN